METLNKDQKKAYRTLSSGKNVFLTGDGGTGKTYLLEKYITDSEAEGKNVLVVAPTGIAALKLNGQTMHTTFAIPIPAYGHYDFDITLSKIKAATVADIIIIEEISMCRNDVFEYFGLIIKKIQKTLKRKPQIIVSGDFYQLPPIVKKDELPMFKKFGLHESGYCFTTQAWKNFKFKVVQLTQPVRQSDNEFIQNLNLLRNGDLKCLEYFNNHLTKEEDVPDDTVYICSTNAQASEINMNELAKLEGAKFVYPCEREKICAKEYTVDDLLILKPGCKVMFMANDVIYGKYHNGEMGTVKECFDDFVTVQLSSGDVISVGQYEWKSYKTKVTNGILEKQQIGSYKQLPLKLAYAITMHKTQGQTYEKGAIYPQSFADGQLYVALSRLKNPEHMYLLAPIYPEYVKVNKLVNKFYETFTYEIPKTILDKRTAVEKKANEAKRRAVSKKPTEARAKGALKEPNEAKRKRLRSNPNVASAEGVPKEPTAAKRKRLRSNPTEAKRRAVSKKSTGMKAVSKKTSTAVKRKTKSTSTKTKTTNKKTSSKAKTKKS